MKKLITTVISEADERAVNDSVAALKNGEIVALPTETVYGLAGDATNPESVALIYKAKGRPANNPLICHVSNMRMAQQLVHISPTAETLIRAFWPGPLTLVLPQREGNGIPEAVSAGLSTLAVRCPAQQTTRQIIEQLGHPIAAPSANPSGKLSPTCAEDVEEGLAGKVRLVIDGGSTQVGIESTIVGEMNGKLILLRPGSITADEIAEAAGQVVYDRDDDKITAPGQLASHYAPNALVQLNSTKKEAGSILIGFDKVEGDYNLSPSGNLSEAAHNLFKIIRKADKQNPKKIHISPIPQKGIGIAINDRLRRAAAPRETQ